MIFFKLVKSLKALEAAEFSYLSVKKADQRYFFNKISKTNTGFASLALKYKKNICPIHSIRKENVSLLPYSPLAGGVLSGKYQSEVLPDGARFTDYLSKGGERQKKMAARFINPRTLQVTQKLMEIATEIGMSVTTLATIWSKQHDFVASTIIGASESSQLDETLAAADQELDSEIISRKDYYKPIYQLVVCDKWPHF